MKRVYALLCAAAIILIGGVSIYMSRQSSSLRNTNDDTLRKSVMQALPASYAQDFEMISHRTARDQLVVVCSNPCPAPKATHTPPYVRLFLISVTENNARLLWNSELVPDNICIDLSLAETKNEGVIVSLISRPYAGSNFKYHLRLFRCGPDHHALQNLRKIDFIDGSSVMLPGTLGTPPAFLVCAPLESSENEAGAKKYSCTIYSMNKNGHYQIGNKLVTSHSYDSEFLAYQELKPELQRKIGSNYHLPNSLPNLEDVGV